MATKPVTDGHISSPYGERISPITQKKEFHPGIDVASPTSNPAPRILAALRCKVVLTGRSPTFGERVGAKLLDEKYKGYSIVYAHMKEISPQLKPGDILEEGDFIGIMGSTGMSAGRHTHIEIRPDLEKPGGSINPTEISDTFK